MILPVRISCRLHTRIGGPPTINEPEGRPRTGTPLEPNRTRSSKEQLQEQPDPRGVGRRLEDQQPSLLERQRLEEGETLQPIVDHRAHRRPPGRPGRHGCAPDWPATSFSPLLSEARAPSDPVCYNL